MEIISSFLIVVIASFFLGTFGLGMKYNKPLAWEAFWSIHSITGMLVAPFLYAIIVVPDLFETILSADQSALIRGSFFGFIWGIGGVLFGVSIKYVGVSLTYGVVMGTTGAIGGLVPFFQMKDYASNPGFKFIILGIIIILTGVAIIAFAGIRREKILSEQGREIEGIKKGKDFWKGILIVSISGIFSAFLNIGFANAMPVAENAIIHGATKINASMAAWVVVLSGAFSFNILYALVLLIRNNTWKSYAYKNTGRAYSWAVLSALLWFGSMAIYGIGAAKMGKLGPVVGWPVFVGLSLIFSNMWALRAGEWRNTGKTKRLLYLGVIILIIATAILAFSNFLQVQD